MQSSTVLSPTARTEAVASLSRTAFDVLVVGGGIVGAAAALDAVTRGLRVGLVEAADWGSGESSRTGRLIEGGLSALPQVAEVSLRLRERDLLLDRLAPHLVHRVPLLRALHSGPVERVTAGSALALYDTLAALAGSREVVPAHRELSARAVRRIAIALNPEHVTGGVQRYEALVDDARLALTLVRTAAGYGAVTASRVRVAELLRDDGRVAGVRARDRVGEEELTISARAVVLAAGAANTALAGGDGAPDQSPGRQTAAYAVVPRHRIRTTTGLLLGATTDHPVTLLPWGRHWIIGPGPARPSGPDGAIAPGRADVQGLLDLVNNELAAPLGLVDVEGVFTGSAPVSTASVRGEMPGLVLATSPDLTRYRLCAARAVDLATRALGGLPPSSVSHRVPLSGADGYHALWNQRHLLAARAGVPVARLERLLNRYGSQVTEVLQTIEAAPESAAPLDTAGDYLQAEAVHAVTHEGALDLEDVLARRLRLTTQSVDGGAGVAPLVAAVIAPFLDWDPSEAERRLAAFRAALATDRDAWVDAPHA